MHVIFFLYVTVCNQSLCELLIPECSSLEKLVTYYSEESCCPSYVCGRFLLKGKELHSAKDIQ